MSPRPLIFISAVSRELRSARQLVANTLTFLGYQPVWQEIFGTEGGDLRAMLRQQIDQCKGVVQLVGQSYGAEPPIADEQFGRVSYTQYEALYARDHGKKVWYLFIDESFPRDAHEPEAQELVELQAEYRRRMQTDAHLFHSLDSSAALESSVLKLRNDLGRLRRGVKQWAGGVVVLLILLSGAVFWLVQTQRGQTGAIQKQGEQVTAIVDRYQKMEHALVRLADVEAQAKQGAKLSSEEQRARAYAVLEKEMGLPSGSLAKELPAFALGLYNNSDTSPMMKARAAYALNKFEEAEKLGLESAEQERQAYESSRRVSEQRRQSAIDSFLLAGRAAQKRIQYDSAMKHFREAEKLTDRSGNPTEWARVQQEIASLLSDNGKYAEAAGLFRSVADLRTKVLGAEDADTLNARVGLAAALSDSGNYLEAEVESRAVIGSAEKALGVEHQTTLRARNTLLVVLMNDRKWAEAEPHARALVALRSKALGPTNQYTLRSRQNLANVLEGEKKVTEAEAEYRQTLVLTEQTLGPEHPDALGCRNNIAAVLSGQAKYHEAGEVFRSLVGISERSLGPEHPRTLLYRHNVATTMNRDGRFAEGEVEARKVIELREKVLGPQHPFTIGSRLTLIEALREEGKLTEAESEARNALALQEKSASGEADLGFARAFLASVLLEENQLPEAASLLRSAIDSNVKLNGPDDAVTLMFRSDWAELLRKEGKYAEAETECRAVETLQQKVAGEDDPETLHTGYRCANILLGGGDLAQAETKVRQVLSRYDKVLGAGHPRAVLTCLGLAQCLAREDKVDEAKTLTSRACETSRGIWGPEGAPTVRAEKLRGDLNARQ
ncbi:MAG: tetratricopeptide repeat protein [Chthoniobacterales bacterium]|nr:tetratricopeptide repeat protein [Chthoniobacterales bacterium]